MKQFFEGLFFLAIGVAFCGAATFSWLRTRRFVEESVTAFGEVVGLREYSGDGVTYAPVIRFDIPGGGVSEFTESISSSPPAHKVGDRVKILYHRDDPSRARVASTLNLYLLTIIFAAIGGSLVVAGLLMAVFAFIS